MIKIDYPAYEYKIRKDGNREAIFDELRKAWVRLTPEEWVRQNFIRFLISKNYAASLVAVEKQIRLGEMVKRFDIVVYDSNHQPWMMIECKAMSVALTPEVLQQALRYNIAVPVTYIVITNGSYCMVFSKAGEKLIEEHEFPQWEKF